MHMRLIKHLYIDKSQNAFILLTQLINLKINEFHVYVRSMQSEN